jgi:hypothetical protein
VGEDRPGEDEGVAAWERRRPVGELELPIATHRAGGTPALPGIAISILTPVVASLRLVTRCPLETRRLVPAVAMAKVEATVPSLDDWEKEWGGIHNAACNQSCCEWFSLQFLPIYGKSAVASPTIEAN